jgi:hypothetical protein
MDWLTTVGSLATLGLRNKQTFRFIRFVRLSEWEFSFSGCPRWVSSSESQKGDAWHMNAI